MNPAPSTPSLGFSLIELLITISIITLLTGLTITGYGTFNQKQTVKTVASQLVSNLRLIQQKAISGEKPTGCDGDLQNWQISVTAADYSQIAVCESSSVTVINNTFPVNISSSSGTAAFAALTGSLANGSTNTFTVSDTASNSHTIEITSSGGINLFETPDVD